jgi:hypothetical protein
MKVPARLTGGAAKHSLAANGNGSLSAAVLASYSDEDEAGEDDAAENESSVDEPSAASGDDAGGQSHEHTETRSDRTRETRRSAPSEHKSKSSSQA